MKRVMFFLVVLVLTLVGVAQAQDSVVLLSEDFEGLPLGPNVDEGTAGDEVWTDIPPAGWINDANDVPGIEDPSTDGVTEWAGWAFADKEWWIQAAGDQDRSTFDLGKGIVAIADPDEWDDTDHPDVPETGTYTVWLSTAPIDLSSTRPGTVELKFDSSWRPEYDDNYHQSAKITVSFDGGEPEQVMLWVSDSGSPNYKEYATNETVKINIDNPAGATNMVITFGMFDAGNDWWWAIDNILVTGDRSADLAYNPDPANGSVEVSAKPAMSWTPGSYVGGLSPQHQIILSDDLAAVEDGSAVVATQDANSFDATGLLDFSTTYYWRIDEANSVSGWDQGNVWSFTTESFIYAVEGVTATTNGISEAGSGPENLVNGSGLNADDQHSTASADMWLTNPPADEEPLYVQFEFENATKLYDMSIWNFNGEFELILGFGIKDVTVEYSADGAEWTALGDVELPRASATSDYTAGTTVDFGGVAAKYVRLTVNSSWGGMGQFGLSEVRFMQIPAQARGPEPADASAGAAIDTHLTWHPGREAVSHDVYFGADPEALDLAGTTDAARFVPGVLDLSTTYYWKVDEVNEADAVTTWEGSVWSFTTEDYIVVDDFEGYTDEEGSRIYEAWIDGYTNGTGSTVGYFEEPFAEHSIVNSGATSMPLDYDNSGSATSEADLSLAQDWTASGVTSLSLAFYGDPDNTGQLFVKINGTQVTYDGDLTQEAWQVWNIDLATVGNVSNVNTLTIGVEGSGAAGTLYIDDIRLYAEVPQETVTE